MKKITAIFIILAFYSSICFGREPTIASIKKGQAAPYDGILYDYESNATLQVEIDAAEKICKTDSELNSGIEKEKCESDKKLLDIQNNKNQLESKVKLDLCYKDMKSLEEIISRPVAPIVLTEASPKHWWFVVGAIVGIAIGGGTMYLSSKIN